MPAVTFFVVDQYTTGRSGFVWYPSTGSGFHSLPPCASVRFAVCVYT